MSDSGMAKVNGAVLHYEVAGEGMPFVMLHAGVADSRQWNKEFAHFAKTHQVVRFDMCGFGQSEPVEREYSLLNDLTALLKHLELGAPLVMMGCSMGGGLAIDYALANPGRIAALILVGSGPSGLELDVSSPEKFKAAESAYHAKDWDLLAEIETQIWFDGMGRTSREVDQEMRQLAYEMNRLALSHEAKDVGTRVPSGDGNAVQRLGELTLPVQIIVGNQDIPYILAAADYMLEHLPNARKAVIEDAGHLPNLEHPEQFRALVSEFLAAI